MKITKLLFLILFGFIWSSSSQALFVWVVESGQDPFSNSQNTLQIPASTTILDLYYDAQGDTVHGYDFILDILGTGSISNVGGGDSGLGSSTATGWRQFGNDALAVNGETGNSVLGFSFDFTGDIGSSLSISGTFTDISFNDTPITASTLITVVPIPAAFWLFGTALIGISGLQCRNKLTKY